MANPDQDVGLQLQTVPTNAVANVEPEDRSRSSRRPEGYGPGTRTASLAGDIALDPPEQANDPQVQYMQNLYAQMQHTQIQDFLQANIRQNHLHLYQDSRADEVAAIAELRHQQTLAGQRAELENQAMEQMGAWQQQAQEAYMASLTQAQVDANRQYQQLQAEAQARIAASQKEVNDTWAEAQRVQATLTDSSLRENQLQRNIEERDKQIEMLQKTNLEYKNKHLEQDERIKELSMVVDSLMTRMKTLPPDATTRMTGGMAEVEDDQELIPGEQQYPVPSPTIRGSPFPGGPPSSPSSGDDDSSGRGRKLKKDRKAKKERKKKKKDRKSSRRRRPDGSSPSGSSPSSSSTSESDRRLRRKLRKALEAEGLSSQKGKEADKILIPKFPRPENYRNWRMRVREAVGAASKDPDKAIRWLDKVYKDKVQIEDLADSEGMATLDAKLLSSLTNIAEGDLARKLDNVKEAALVGGTSTRGRQALWLFHDHFSTHVHLGAIYALEDLMSVRMRNDDLQSFVTNWDSVLAGLQKPPADDVLETYFHLNIKRFRPLEHDLNIYERAPIGSTERSYKWLYERATQYLERRRLEKMRDATRNKLAGKGGKATPGIEKKQYCFAFQRGECKKGQSCPFLHEKAPQPTKGKPKKGKGKGKSRSPSRSLSPGSRDQVCKFWKANGSCRRGDQCAFAHPPDKKGKALASTGDDKRKSKDKKDKKKKKEGKSSSRSSSQTSAGSASLKKTSGTPKGGKTGSAAVCLMRALILAAVVQPGRGILVQCRPEGSIVARTLHEQRQVSFTEEVETATFHAYETWDLRRPTRTSGRDGAKLGKKPKLNFEKIADSAEDAILAAQMLESSVKRELSGVKCKCKFLCDSDIGCKYCITKRLQSSGEEGDPRRNAVATAAVEIAWIADTGASQDLICESLVEPSSIRKAKQPLMLTTANGSKIADKVTSYQVDMLDTQLEPYVLEDTPSVISVGRKCLVDGWEFVWRAFSRPFLRRPDGMKVKMEVHEYVPYIPSSNGTAMTALGMRYEDNPDRTAEADAGCASGGSSETVKVEPAAPVESSVVEGEVPEFEFDPFEYAPETPSENVKEAPELPDEERAEEDPVEEKIDEDDEDLMGDEGPPTEAEKDERLKIKPVENQRDMGKEALRREACSLQHLMTHVPKNPFCDICNRARMTKRTARSHGESKHVKATKFGDHITADHLINYGERNEGGSGELVAMVFKDVYTDIRYCYPAARKHTRDCVEAMKHFVGPDVEVGIFYSDEAPELKRAASEMRWRHHVGTAYVSQTNAVAERNRSSKERVRICFSQV